MKHKILKKLSIGLLVAGSVAGVSYATVQAINANTSTTTKLDTQTVYKDLATFTVGAKDPATKKYTLTINNKDPEKGTVTFTDGNVSGQFAIGETITLAVSIKDPNYVPEQIKVHSQSNVDKDGIGNNTLGVNQIDGATYEFKLPPETSPDGRPNPFYDGNKSLSVDVSWTLKSINSWEYEWIDGTDSGLYAISVNEDNFIFDDVAHPDLAMKTVQDSLTGANKANVIFRIYLNGHNMAIRNMTIPSGVQLMFINNKTNTNNGERPVISLTKDSKFSEYDVHGVIGRWGSVDFSKELKTKLNLNVAHGWWDSNANE